MLRLVGRLGRALTRLGRRFGDALMGGMCTPRRAASPLGTASEVGALGAQWKQSATAGGE